MSAKAQPKSRAGKGRPEKKPDRPRPKTKARQNGKHPGGRPPAYDDPAKLKADCDAYFEACAARMIPIQMETKEGIVTADVNRPEIPTKAGLRLALHMDETVIYRYEEGQHGEEFGKVLREAYDRIEEAVTRYGFDGKNDRFATFYLGAAFKRTAKVAVEATGPDGTPLVPDVSMELAALRRIVKRFDEQKKPA